MNRYFFIFLFFIEVSVFAVDLNSQRTLRVQYENACRVPSPVYEHVATLRRLAMQCSSVTEIGLWEMTSSWGLLQGLAESSASLKSYTGIDLRSPENETLELAEKLAKSQGIYFQFLNANDMYIHLEPTDLLFIDSLHTYCHLSYELEKFSSKVSKYIVMHDTSAPWGERNDDDYSGDYSEYPNWISREQKGTWAAVVDFLSRHPEWMIAERHLNCHGLTVLKRV